MLRASVIIPTYNDWKNLAICLDHLGQQTIQSTEFEVIVANNNPDQPIPDKIAKCRNVRIIPAPVPGSYAARNAGISQATAPYLFFVDADCRPAPDWLSQGLKLFANAENHQRIAGEVEVFPASGRWNGWGLQDSIFNLSQKAYSERGFAATANLAVERSVLDEVGAFLETSFSGEDKEWNKRATKAGIPLVYSEQMKVAHPARESFAECAKKRRRLAGARFVAKANRPIARRLPRLHYLLPSPTACWAILMSSESAPLRTRISAMWCHYVLGWVHNLEILRLGFFGRVPER